MAYGLAGHGIETHVATTDDNGPDRLNVPLNEPVIDGGVVYWYFPRQTHFYICSLPFTEWLWRNAKNYDLIHIHFVFSYCSNVAAWIARRRGIPYIMRPVGVLNRWGIRNRRPWLKRVSFAVVEKPLLSGAAFVHYTAEQERVEASDLGFVHTSMIIPNPVEISHASREELQGRFRSRYPELGGRPLIVFLSRIDRKKGLDLLIRAFRQVVISYPDAVLVIAGDGDRDLIDTLQRDVHEGGIDASVFWVGFLNGIDKFEALADADIFVLPSYSENFGIAIVEAMALGVPVVITDQVGIHNEVAEHCAGIVITPTAEPLIKAIHTLLSDAHLRLRLGQNGTALVHSEFDAATVISKVVGAYREVLGKSNL
jgi:glycosyltransferase involved in cell wall biosynthesis